ncbi:MAG: alpha/beta hydrolase [Desulfobacteraceae bacterium]|nr:MAG: alpha/beta hydrolase [Desulfobacteraceae bacterium]
MSKQETIHFMSDGLRLTGTLHLPDREQPPVVIGCHGLLADRQSPKQIALAEALNRIGIAYLRFDHRGCGDSQGDLQPGSLLPSRSRDLYHAIARMQTYSPVGAVIGLFGSSFGGTVVIATAVQWSVPGIVTYAAPIHSQTLGKAAGQQIRAQHALPDNDLAAISFDIRPCLSGLKNILIVHGTSDDIVPPDHALRIFEAAREPKKLISLEGGDHPMSNPAHQRRFMHACTAWFKPFSSADHRETK